MKNFDRKLKNLLKKEAPELPEDVSERMDKTVENLCSVKKKKSRIWPVVGRVAVVALLVMIILPNISRDVAYAMMEVPVLGDFVKAVTVWEWYEDDGRVVEDVRLPEISGSNEMKELISEINGDIAKKAKETIDQFETDSSEITGAHFSLKVDYQIITDTDDWFTLKFVMNEITGSSSIDQVYYHIDKKHLRRVSLSNLFKKDFDYVTVFSDYLYDVMQREMAENEEVMYWSRDKDTTYFGYEGINPDQNFYFNDDGELVIVFDKYQVAPGAMGCPEFVIPKTLYENNLLYN